MNITKEILENILKESLSLSEVYTKLNLKQKSKVSKKKLLLLIDNFRLKLPNYKRNSPIWLIDLFKLKLIVKNSKTFKEVLFHFDLFNKGANNRTLKQRLIKENIDFSHLKQAKGLTNKRYSSEEIFTINEEIKRSSVKKRILKENLLPYICSCCKIKPFWKGKSLVLILDHINGIPNDHRIENLRFVCPNCNSQLDTTTGKNNKKEINNIRSKNAKKIEWSTILNFNKYHFFSKKINLLKTISILNKPKIKLINNHIKKSKYKKEKLIKNKIEYICKECKIILNKKTKNSLCKECFDKSRRTKERPSVEELKKELIEIGSYVKLGKKYKVSDNTIRKWLKEDFDIRIEKWKETIYKVKEDSLKENILLCSYRYSTFINTLKSNIRNKNLNEEQLKVLDELNIDLVVREKQKRKTSEELFKERK